MPALCRGSWVVTAAIASTVVSTAPLHCAPLPEEVMSPTVSSSRLKKTHGQLATDPAPSASQVPTRPGKSSKMAYREATVVRDSRRQVSTRRRHPQNHG